MSNAKKLFIFFSLFLFCFLALAQTAKALGTSIEDLIK